MIFRQKKALTNIELGAYFKEKIKQELAIDSHMDIQKSTSLQISMRKTQEMN